MKVLDIALKDLTRSFRSASALVFMFVLPLMVTGLFYFMFGFTARSGGFSLPRVKVAIANLDKGGPKFQASTKNIPGSLQADTMGELVTGVLQSEDVADLLEVSLVPDASAAHAAVDSEAAQVAIIIPEDFSRQFADLNGQAVIELYQDPTLTIGPGIVKAIMSRFMDSMSGVLIALDVALDQDGSEDYRLAGQVVQEYLEFSLVDAEDPAEALLDVRLPQGSKESESLLVQIVGPIMGGMMIMYAFYTGTTTAQSLLREEEELTLPRLFTTPTPQSIILSGKFLHVFLTALVQVSTLLLAAHLIFGIEWGDSASVALAGLGIVITASSAGIFINSMIKTTKQGGVIFGGLLTITGMIGMISVFTTNSPGSADLTGTVSLLVPQGWAVRGLLQAMDGEPLIAVLVNFLVLMTWSAVFFLVGVWRFNRRYV